MMCSQQRVEQNDVKPTRVSAPIRDGALELPEWCRRMNYWQFHGLQDVGQQP